MLQTVFSFKTTEVTCLFFLFFSLLYEIADVRKKKKTRVVIPGVYSRMMTRIIKPDVAPGEFKCRTCYTMWSSYMENHILCTDITERYGLHDFDFAKPII